MCTQLRNWIWDAEQGFRLGETGLQLQAGTSWFDSSPSYSIEKLPHMMYFLVWGHGKQARVTRLHWTSWAIHGTSWSGKSTSGGDQVCRSALYGGGQALGSHSPFREYVETHWILSGHDTTTVRCKRPWCRDHWVIYISCDPAGAIGCQVGRNQQVRSLDTRN